MKCIHDLVKRRARDSSVLQCQARSFLIIFLLFFFLTLFLLLSIIRCLGLLLSSEPLPSLYFFRKYIAHRSHRGAAIDCCPSLHPNVRERSRAAAAQVNVEKKNAYKVAIKNK